LASNTAPVLSTMPSSVAAIQRITGWRTQLWTSLTTCPVVRSYHCRLPGRECVDHVIVSGEAHLRAGSFVLWYAI
jgi:hypothetical protein